VSWIAELIRRGLRQTKPPFCGASQIPARHSPAAGHIEMKELPAIDSMKDRLERRSLDGRQWDIEE
jgi:hypothetical protein